MDATVVTAFWRNLETEGHDACRLLRRADGWTLHGHAVFRQDGRPCSLGYRVDCDGAWRTRAARVEGWLGPASVALAIAGDGNGTWTLDGAEQPQLAGCIDLDLGLTPATNLVPLRRLALPIGEAGPAPAAYLRFPELTLEVLDQHYRRIDETRYAYESPAFGYAETLTVDASGFVTRYPGLWEGEVRREG